MFTTIDFGVNYANKKKMGFAKVKKVVEDSFFEGVDKIVCISNTVKECVTNIKYSSELINLHFTLGVHPIYSDGFRDEDIDFIEKNLETPKCFGIGEFGLDYHHGPSKEIQMNAFEKQLILAKKTNAKMYLHCRDAFDDFISIIKKHEYYNGFIHCFTGTLEQAIEYKNLGFKIGVTGYIFRNPLFASVIGNDLITLDDIIVETDAPHMRIHPKKFSSPSDILTIIKKISELKKMDYVECGNKLYQTSLKFLLEK